LILTFVRTTELRAMQWEEIDFINKKWHIPAHRMKMRQKHIVPLSTQSLAILEQLKQINGNRKYTFPNRKKPQTFISENTMLYAIYRMGYHGKATTHGFNADHIERQLAHSEGNSVRASYNHADYLEERASMMQWWADYLDKLGISC
jgi:integrase